MALVLCHHNAAAVVDGADDAAARKFDDLGSPLAHFQEVPDYALLATIAEVDHYAVFASVGDNDSIAEFLMEYMVA
jgi:hypothetical protein